jgi:hypothetical protein
MLLRRAARPAWDVSDTLYEAISVIPLMLRHLRYTRTISDHTRIIPRVYRRYVFVHTTHLATAIFRMVQPGRKGLRIIYPSALCSDLLALCTARSN